jgi:hypothetical protein
VSPTSPGHARTLAYAWPTRPTGWVVAKGVDRDGRSTTSSNDEEDKLVRTTDPEGSPPC